MSESRSPSPGTGRRVVVTGMGFVSALGHHVCTFGHAIRAGRSRVGTIRAFDASRYCSRIAGEVHDFDPSDLFDRKTVDRVDRFGHFAVAASAQALRDSGLEEVRTAVVNSFGFGGNNAVLVLRKWEDR